MKCQKFLHTDIKGVIREILHEAYTIFKRFKLIFRFY